MCLRLMVPAHPYVWFLESLTPGPDDQLGRGRISNVLRLAWQEISKSCNLGGKFLVISVSFSGDSPKTCVSFYHMLRSILAGLRQQLTVKPIRFGVSRQSRLYFMFDGADTLPQRVLSCFIMYEFLLFMRFIICMCMYICIHTYIYIINPIRSDQISRSVVSNSL